MGSQPFTYLFTIPVTILRSLAATFSLSFADTEPSSLCCSKSGAFASTHAESNQGAIWITQFVTKPGALKCSYTRAISTAVGSTLTATFRFSYPGTKSSAYWFPKPAAVASSHAESNQGAIGCTQFFTQPGAIGRSYTMAKSSSVCRAVDTAIKTALF